MINPLQLVSITDFILAIECLFLSGILFGKINLKSSPTMLLALFLFFAGMAAFFGGIDHGFFQPINLRYYPRTFTYLSIAFGTFFLFRYTVTTFFSKKLFKTFNIIMYGQLIAFVISSFLYHNFLLVIANYAPVLLLFFVMQLINRKEGKSNGKLILFCITMFAATCVQMSGIQISALVNSDSLFHLIAMLGYFFFYFGCFVKKYC
ncbi:MAG: hypothetical protein JKY69_04200 [Flavobacteriaceae bacterium]|nr:hypothetical protein [Flavobacteriaceae bacterium]